MALFKAFNHHDAITLRKILFGNESTSGMFNKAMQT